MASLVVATVLAACGMKGDPQLPEGVTDTVPFPGQYPAPETVPGDAETPAETGTP